MLKKNYLLLGFLVCFISIISCQIQSDGERDQLNYTDKNPETLKIEIKIDRDSKVYVENTEIEMTSFHDIPPFKDLIVEISKKITEGCDDHKVIVHIEMSKGAIMGVLRRVQIALYEINQEYIMEVIE